MEALRKHGDTSVPEEEWEEVYDEKMQERLKQQFIISILTEIWKEKS